MNPEIHSSLTQRLQSHANRHLQAVDTPRGHGYIVLRHYAIFE